MKIECNNGPLMAGENDARILALTVEEAYASHEIRLAFLTPTGHRCLSPEIRMENGAAAYPLPACLLDASGKLLAQIVAENGEGQVAKSEVYAFSVERSIQCDDGDFTQAGFVTLGALDDAVKDLQADMASLSPAAFSGSYADLTDTPDIPVIPQNVSAFENDAGYLTQHQSLAAYYTADETDAAIAEAIEGRGSGSIYFGKCKTAASTQTKVVEVGEDFQKTQGCVLNVWFYYADTGTNDPLLKIGDDTAVGVYYDAAGLVPVSKSTRAWDDNSIVQLTYRNGRWVLVGASQASTTHRGLTKLNDTVTSTSTKLAATANAVKQAYDKAAAADTKATAADTKATAAAAATTEKTGTFTPNFTPDAFMDDTVADIKQIGNVVYLSASLRIDGTWSDLGSNLLGTISGVEPPQDTGSECIPVCTIDNNGNMHAGYVSVAQNNGSTVVYANVNAADSLLLINGFYFTA